MQHCFSLTLILCLHSNWTPCSSIHVLAACDWPCRRLIPRFAVNEAECVGPGMDAQSQCYRVCWVREYLPIADEAELSVQSKRQQSSALLCDHLTFVHCSDVSLPAQSSLIKPSLMNALKWVKSFGLLNGSWWKPSTERSCWISLIKPHTTTRSDPFWRRMKWRLHRNVVWQPSWNWCIADEIDSDCVCLSRVCVFVCVTVCVCVCLCLCNPLIDMDQG